MNKHSSHPIAAFCYTGTLFILAMSWSSPGGLIILLALTLVCLSIASNWRAWRNVLALSLSMALVICLVNSLFAAGNFRISVESLLFGLSMGLKVPLSVGIFILCGELMDGDEALSFFSRFAPKSSLVVTLAALMIPRLRRDMERIHTVMSMRGAGTDVRNPVARIKALRPILHVLLLSSLEGSWDTAVSLNCRAFGSGERNSYGHAPWKTGDGILAGGAVVALILFAIDLIYGRVWNVSGIQVFISILSVMALAFALAWIIHKPKIRNHG
jgi:energy-coupling factor transport system permease protein